MPKDRVAGIDIFTLTAPVPPFSDARHYIAFREAMWVRLRTAEGLVGWGESAVWGGPAAVTTAAVAAIFRNSRRSRPMALPATGCYFCSP